MGEMNKEEIKIKVDFADSWFTWTTIGFGVTQAMLFVKQQATPIGFVWGIWFGAGNAGKERFEVTQSFTIPWARRQGVRTRINDEIFRLTQIQIITTQNGSDDGGKAFMENYGYELNQEIGLWSITKEKRNLILLNRKQNPIPSHVAILKWVR